MDSLELAVVLQAQIQDVGEDVQEMSGCVSGWKKKPDECTASTTRSHPPPQDH